MDLIWVKRGFAISNTAIYLLPQTHTGQ